MWLRLRSLFYTLRTITRRFAPNGDIQSKCTVESRLISNKSLQRPPTLLHTREKHRRLLFVCFVIRITAPLCISALFHQHQTCEYQKEEGEYWCDRANARIK